MASNQQAASERRVVKEDELHAELEQQDELHAELEQQVQRDDEAAPAQPPAAAGSWRTGGARSSSSRFADLAVHLAQRQLKNLR